MQILLKLNFLEGKELEYWLTDNHPEYTIREVYDRWENIMEAELYRLEGPTDEQLECFIKLKYGNKVVKTRFKNGTN
jgi:hypothetical protein